MTKKDVKDFILDSIEEIKLELMKEAKQSQTIQLSVLIMIIDAIQSELLKKLEEGEEK